MRLAGLFVVILGIAFASDVWHLGASSPDSAIGTPMKVLGLGLSALTLMLYAWRVLRASRSIPRAMAWQAVAGASAGFVLAYLEGVRAQWGAACNQCLPWRNLVLWPLGLGAIALICAWPFAWYYRRKASQTAV